MKPTAADGMKPIVVFHADDLGMNDAVNRGIFDAFEHGLLTSASLLSNAPAAAAAAAEWHRRSTAWQHGNLASRAARASLGDDPSRFDLGVHLNLTQGRPLTGSRYPQELLDGRGCFPGIGWLFVRLLSGRPAWLARLREELAAQIQWMLDHGLQPTHLNGHQYVEMLPAVAKLLPGLLEQFQIQTLRRAYEHRLLRTTLLRGDAPLAWLLAVVKRHFAGRLTANLDQHQFASPDAFYGTAHAGRIDLPLVSAFLAAPLAPLTEICVHPGTMPAGSYSDDADGWVDPLAAKRPRELTMLTSAQLADLLRSRGAALGRLSRLAA